MAVIDPTSWQTATGQTLTGSDLVALSSLCHAVSDALTRRCYPVLLEPKTLTQFPFDAHPDDKLFLPRPIRSITNIWVRHGANGDASLLESTDLLTAGADYYNRPDDVLTGWNRSGIVYRRRGAFWGYEWHSPAEKLAYKLNPNLGAVFVSGAFGPTSVPPAVQEAGHRVVTLLLNSRELGGAAQSNSWNGGSYSLAGSVTADSALNSPDVVSLLMSAGALPLRIA